MDDIDRLTQGCFNAIIALRHVDDQSAQQPERLQRELRKQIDKMVQRAGKAGLAHQDGQDMAYAIVALVDELALKGSAEVSQYWISHLLQMAYFKENTAGEGFFQRLEQAKNDERYAVLRVYYLCLLFGFQGRYGVRGGDAAIGDLILAARYALAKGGLRDVESLSPQAERPKELLATNNDMGKKLVWLPASAMGIAIVLYIVLSATLASRASGVTAFIETLLK